MQVEVQPMGHPALTILMSFQDFLQGPVMSHLAAVNNDADPVEVLCDYLPADLQDLDDDEFAQLLEEACVMACNDLPPNCEPVEFGNVHAAWLEEDDLVDARRLLLPHYGLQLVGAGEMPAA